MLKSTHKAVAPAATLPPLPDGWTEHTAPTGHTYYYNVSTKQSTYTRPAIAEDEPLQIDFNATQPDFEIQGALLAQDQFQKSQFLASADPRGQSHFTGGRSYQDQSRRRGHGGDRPSTKAPIPDCEPWMLIKTKFNRRFVHNTETKQSLWKFPQNVMMKVIDMDRAEWEARQKAEGQEQVIERPESKKVEPAKDATPQPGGDYDSDEYEEVEVTDDEGGDGADPASKRPRLSPQPEAPPGPVEFDEDDIEWQLAQTEQDEDANEYADPEAEDEAGGLPLTEDDTVALFRSLLDDFHISPYATFEKIIEDDHLIDDDRYVALPNMHRRREVFQDWSRDRAAELKSLKTAQQTQKEDPRAKYLRFLQKNATPKLYWPEFKRKFKKEDEMKDYEVSDKDREKLYREYVSKVKGSEIDRRKDLLALLKGVSQGELNRQSRIEDMPENVKKDLRFWLLDEKRRDEIVEGFISTLHDD